MNIPPGREVGQCGVHLFAPHHPGAAPLPCFSHLLVPGTVFYLCVCLFFPLNRMGALTNWGF